MPKRFATYDVFVAFLVLLSVAAIDVRAQDKRESDSSKGAPQKEGQGKSKDKLEAANLDSLTKLRREQKKRDPIAIEVEIPKNFRATTRKLPILKVTLKNVDEEKEPVEMAFSDRNSCVGFWRFEVRDSNGKLLPQPEWLPGSGDIAYSPGNLEYGEIAQSTLAMTYYARITEPGEYTVQVFYHDATQASVWVTEANNPNWSTSKEFKLKVGEPIPLVFEVPAGWVTCIAVGSGVLIALWLFLRLFKHGQGTERSYEGNRSHVSPPAGTPEA